MIPGKKMYSDVGWYIWYICEEYPRPPHPPPPPALQPLNNLNTLNKGSVTLATSRMRSVGTQPMCRKIACSGSKCARSTMLGIGADAHAQLLELPRRMATWHRRPQLVAHVPRIGLPGILAAWPGGLARVREAGLHLLEKKGCQ